MGDKPFLQIEFDEHYSKVGVITRIEAFLNSISHRPPVQVPDGFNILDVDYHPTFITDRPAPDRTVLLPQAGWATPYLADYFRRQWLAAEEMPAFDRESLTAGRSEMNSKEYLPLPMLVGSAFRALRDRRGADVQFLIPYGYGADADGQYARAVCTVLDRSGHRDTAIAAPILEELPQHAADPDLLLRAVLTGDVLYAALADMRAQLAPQAIPTWEELTRLAAQISALPHGGNRLAAVGSPLCITSLNEGILDTLEREGYQIARMPLVEMLWVLWRDNGTAAPE